jgi:uncharacterized membrane protein YagU involved in acid resistance
MKLAAFAEDAAIAGVAGYVGTKVMEPVSMKLYSLESEAARKQEDEARPGPPYELAARKLDDALNLGLDDAKLQRLAMAFHYGLAVSWAPLYEVLRRRTRMAPVTAGITTGAAMSVIADEMLTPRLGFSGPNRAYPLVTHLRGFLAHLAFGVAVAGVTEAAWALLRRRP